jgi:cytochrome c biogenesis protein CcmG, thiol:disulfide interchange protein DsbE
MKHSQFITLQIFLLMLFGFSSSLVGFSQNPDSSTFKIPSVDLKTVDGLNFNSSEITKQGKPIVIVFWKSCCKPNINMLDAINEVYADWQKETGVILYAVSIDDSRNTPNIGPLVNGKSWEFNVLLDVNSDFKRAMNVNATPHVFILNKKNEVIWQKNTYIPGEEEEIYQILKNI